MPTRLLYNPVTKKKLRPRIKFNGRRVAILCHKCGKMIKENIKIKELKRIAELLYCPECALEMIMKLFKHTHNE